MPEVSVIVPLYNKAAYIDRCLDAILMQSFTDFELIVVNDGSTDGSEAAVERRRDSRMKLVSQANAGREPRGIMERGLQGASYWPFWMATMPGIRTISGKALRR
jgi:GT2 family glycosyltransferase